MSDCSSTGALSAGTLSAAWTLKLEWAAKSFQFTQQYYGFNFNRAHKLNGPQGWGELIGVAPPAGEPSWGAALRPRGILQFLGAFL